MAFRIGGSIAIVLLLVLPVSANSHSPPIIGTISAPGFGNTFREALLNALNCNIPVLGHPSGPNFSGKIPDGTSLTLTASGVNP